MPDLSHLGAPVAPVDGMARPLRIHLPGSIYHVVSRGNARQDIFEDTRDYAQFLLRLESALERFDLRCLAYCLMPNHLHLLVQVGDLPISRPMQQLLSGYAQWFNRRYCRVGHVFQGRFKSLLVDTNDYLVAVVRYVLRNPVESGLVAAPCDWTWSSCAATLQRVPAAVPLDVDALLDCLGLDVSASPLDQLQALVVDDDRPTESPQGPVVSGSRALLDRVSPLVDPHKRDDEIVRAERLCVRPPLREILSGGTGADSDDQCMYEAFWRHGYRLREIAVWYGIHPTTVSRRIRLLGVRGQQGA